MHPQQLLAIREIGDVSSPYWLAATDDGRGAHLEPDEIVEETGTASVGSLTGGWNLKTATVVVTDRRIVFFTTRYEGGHVPFAEHAAAVAGSLTDGRLGAKKSRSAKPHPPKERRAKPLSGRIAIGHIRYEWLTAVVKHTVKAHGNAEMRGDFVATTDHGAEIVEVSSPRRLTPDHLFGLAASAFTYRASLGAEQGESVRTKLERYANGRCDDLSGVTGKAGDIGWLFPGDTETLVDRALDSTVPQLWAPEPLSP